jgi:hypothetical protein
MSLFNLKTKDSQLVSANAGVSRSYYDKISPTRDISDITFDNSAINIKFSVSGNRWWVPSKSYISIRVGLTQGDDLNEILNTGTLAPGAAACLFQGAELRLNGKTISHIPDNLPQIYSEYMRTMKSSAWLDTIGRSTNKFSNDVYEVEADAGTGVAAHTAIESRHGESLTAELVFQPPLGIFGINHALPAGDYELILLPAPSKSYKVAVIEATNRNVPCPINNTAAGANFTVNSLYFYCNYVEGPRADNTSYIIDLEETGLQTRNLMAGTSTQTSHYEISPSTFAITIAQQAQAVSSTTVPTKFITENRSDKEWTSLRLNYAGQTMPSPDWSADGGEFFTQLYSNNAISTGSFFDTGGSETLDQFREQYGMYAHMRIAKDGMDKSTRLEVSSKHNNNANDMKMLVFYHHRRVVVVKVENSRVVDLVVEDA